MNSAAATTAPSFHVHAPAVAAGIRPFLLDGAPRLAVIVKVGLELRHGQVAQLAAPTAIATVDVYADGRPAGPVVLASDLALRKTACDVTLVGEARAPNGTAAPVLSVRLGVFRGDRPLLKKAVVAMSPTPEGISAVPLTYEQTFGGPDVPANPIGTRAPLVQLARDALQQPGCFAPVPAAWALRRDRVDSATRASLATPVPSIASSTDLGYFQCAPADQTIPFLHGGEWVVIDGVSATRPRVQTQLPALHARALLVERSGATLEVPLVWDTLAIDAVALRAEAVLRGDVAAPLPLERASDLALAVTVGHGSETPLPPLSLLFADDNLAPALHRAAQIAFSATTALDETEHDRAARRAVAPYQIVGGTPDSKPRSAPPAGTPWSAQPAAHVAPARGPRTVPLTQDDFRPPEPIVQATYPAPPMHFTPAPFPPPAPALYPPAPAPAPARAPAPAPAPPSGPNRIALISASLRKSGMSEAALATFIRQLEQEIGSDV